MFELLVIRSSEVHCSLWLFIQGLCQKIIFFARDERKNNKLAEGKIIIKRFRMSVEIVLFDGIINCIEANLKFYLGAVFEALFFASTEV